MGIVIGGYVLFKAANNALAQITGGSENPACSNKLASAKFYPTHILPQAKAYKTAGTNCSHDVFSIEDGAL